MLLLDRFKSVGQNRKVLVSLGLTVLVIVGVLVVRYFTQVPEAEKEFRPISVLVEEVRVGSLSRKITAVGTLIANQTVMIRPEIPGVIGKIHVKGGELVKDGETLFELDDRQIRAELKEQQAKLNFGKVEYNRASSLAAKNFGSQQKLDDSKAKMLMAEAAVESAQLKLERTVIKAPFTGLVGIHNLSIGAVVGPDKELTTFVDLSPMQVEFRIPAQYLKFINEGQRVDVFLDGDDPAKPAPGIISNIDAKIDPNAHSVIIRALISNKKGLLRPGLFARVDLVVGSKDNAMIVSDNSLMSNEGIQQVYKIFEGLAYKVDVRVGIQDGDSFEILQGLAPGDHIVYEGHAKIRDQYPVRYELNGKQYAFDKASFEKKIKELEARKKALESGESSSIAKPTEEQAPAKDETATGSDTALPVQEQKSDALADTKKTPSSEEKPPENVDTTASEAQTPSETKE